MTPSSFRRARYDVIVAGLLIANRPEVYKLLGRKPGPFGDVMPVLKAEFDIFAKGTGTVTADDIRQLLLVPALNEDDVRTAEALWAAAAPLFQTGASDRVQRISWGALSDVLGGEECVLRELQRQVKAYQAAVKAEIAAFAS